MKRTEQKELRRKEILSKSLELFVQKGYDGTKTSEIARSLGMSEGLLFHYFPSKENLYLELVKLGVQGTEVFDLGIDNPYEALYNALDGFFSRAKENRLVAKMFILVDRAQNKESTPEEVYKVATKVNIIQNSVPIIEMGQKKGIFRSGNPLTLSYTFWNAVHGNMEELAKNSEMEVPQTEWLLSILTK